MGDSVQDDPIPTDSVDSVPAEPEDEFVGPSPQEEIANLLRVIEMNKDALAEMQEEVRTFRDSLEEQEKICAELKLERDGLETKVQNLEKELADANQKLEDQAKAAHFAPIVPPVAPIRVDAQETQETQATVQDDSNQDEYPLLIPTPSGNHTTVVVDEEELERMKKDMLEKIRELNREEVARMVDQQDKLRWESANKSREEKPIEEMTTIIVEEHVSEADSRPQESLPSAHTEVEIPATSPNNSNMLHPESIPATNSGGRAGGRMSKKNLYRSGSFTEWSPEMLEGLKSDMMESLREMRRVELGKMLAGQDALRWGDAREKNENDDNASVTSELETLPGPVDRIRGKNLLRNGSKADWSDVDLDQLKVEMYEELTRIHKKELADMISQQDAIRYPQNDGNDELSRTSSQLSQRGRYLNSLSESEVAALRADIVDEITQMTKRELSTMMEKQMQLRWQEVQAASPNPQSKNLQRPPPANVPSEPRDSDNNLFRQTSQERWDVADISKMESEMSKQIADIQRKELQRQFENSNNLLWPTASTEPEQQPKSVTNISVQTVEDDDEPELLIDPNAPETTPGGMDDDLQALNYVAPVTTTDAYTERKQIDPPIIESKERDIEDDDDMLLGGKPTPGATIVDVPDEYTTPGGPDDMAFEDEITPGGDEQETPMGPEPQVIIQVVPLQEHPDFAEYRIQSENAIRGYRQEIAALISKHEEESQAFQESKMQLILSTSAEMDSLRSMIRQMADNFRTVQAQASFRR